MSIRKQKKNEKANDFIRFALSKPNTTPMKPLCNTYETLMMLYNALMKPYSCP